MYYEITPYQKKLVDDLKTAIEYGRKHSQSDLLILIDTIVNRCELDIANYENDFHHDQADGLREIAKQHEGK